MVKLTIDEIEIEAPDGATILEAADAAEIYIPRLCSHPELPAVDPKELEVWDEVYWGSESKKGVDPTGDGGYEGCKLCLVQIEGHDEPVRACITQVEDGMKVVSSTPDIDASRRERMKKIFASHPHACVQCAQKEGCAIEPCSTDVAKEERCCPIFHVCELRRVAEVIGIPDETQRYHPQKLPIIENEPLFLRDYNLCIGCLRCVRMCREVRDVDAIGFVFDADGEPVVGMKADSAKESGCQFCLSCVEVCPTGALRLMFEEARVDGDLVSKCISACPAGIDIPRYLREIRRGEFARAEAIVRESAPLPRVLGQICFHPCEEECLRNELNEPIAICSLKRAAVENAGESIWKSTLKPKESTGKKVAIIGAGPAGLTAAWFLRLKGHDVTVFDSQDKAGGWLRDGIPKFRLTEDALDSDISDIAGIGVDLKLGITVGKDIPFEDLRKDFDAVFIAAGARNGKHLPCEGIDIDGVESGLDLLIEQASVISERSFEGEKVVVIGGGNVAIDVARTIKRLQAAEVHMYCLEERDEMPAHDWEIEEAEAEGIVMHPGWGPTLFAGDGTVERIDFRKCVSVFDVECVFDPKFDESTTTSQDTNRVFIAIGQEPVLDFIEGIKLNPGGTIDANPDSMVTSIDGIFAGGEVVSGPASAVEAIGQGAKAASGIDTYLGGDGDIKIRLLEDTEPEKKLSELDGFFDYKRVAIPHLSSDEAIASFEQIEKCYVLDDAKLEADRCLRCDLRLMLHPVCLPPEPWLEFNGENVEQAPEEEGVYQLLDEQKVVYAIKGVDNIREALSEILETSEKAKFFLFDEDKFFSKRESELIQQYLKVHGCMPPGEGEDDLDDLF